MQEGPVNDCTNQCLIALRATPKGQSKALFLTTNMSVRESAAQSYSANYRHPFELDCNLDTILFQLFACSELNIDSVTISTYLPLHMTSFSEVR